jgi:uncharacterized membrane protein YhaH (DUF805 family)
VRNVVDLDIAFRLPAVVAMSEREYVQDQDPDDQHSPETGQNASDEERRSDHGAVFWFLAILVLLLLMALPVTLAAVAVRPSQATVRAAAMSLLAFVGVVGTILVIGVLP